MLDQPDQDVVEDANLAFVEPGGAGKKQVQHPLQHQNPAFGRAAGYHRLYVGN